MKNQQKRATFEDVCISQDILIDLIDKCIDENKPLDVKDRKKFRSVFRLSTLGLGSEFTFIISGKNKRYNLGHVGHAANWIIYRENSKVQIGEEYMEIKYFWIKLRDMLFVIFDHAIETAIKISKEQTRLGISEAAEV